MLLVGETALGSDRSNPHVNYNNYRKTLPPPLRAAFPWSPGSDRNEMLRSLSELLIVL